MKNDSDFYRLSCGFADSELGSMQTFRAIVKALDNPGHFVQIKSKLSTPEVLNPASAAVLLTLGSDETTVWADFNWSIPLIDWFQIQCGSCIVTEPYLASLVLITKPATMPPLDQFRIGDDTHPDTSSTLIVQVDDPPDNLAQKGAMGSLEVMIADLCGSMNRQSDACPLGVDILLTCDDILTILPRISVDVLENFRIMINFNQ